MTADYELLVAQLEGLLSNETDFIANCANAAALIFQELVDLNWAGVYLLRDGDLVLGPFQGRPACTRIPLGQGVCGRAAAEWRAIIVADVHAFPGHIACDAASNAELVVPLIHEGKLYGVIDLDSPVIDRFSERDRDGLQAVSATLMAASQLSKSPSAEPKSPVPD